MADAGYPALRRAAGRAAGLDEPRRPRHRGCRPASASWRPRANSPVAAMGDERYAGIQFHPEVIHTPQGAQILANFLYGICGCAGDWTPGSFVAESIERIRAQVGDGRVLCGLSGGVDSSVAAALVHRAIGDQLDLHLRRQRPAAQGRGGERGEPSSAARSTSHLVVVDAERALPGAAGRA